MRIYKFCPRNSLPRAAHRSFAVYWGGAEAPSLCGVAPKEGPAGHNLRTGFLCGIGSRKSISQRVSAISERNQAIAIHTFQTPLRNEALSESLARLRRTGPVAAWGRGEEGESGVTVALQSQHNTRTHTSDNPHRIGELHKAFTHKSVRDGHSHTRTHGRSLKLLQ